MKDLEPQKNPSWSAGDMPLESLGPLIADGLVKASNALRKFIDDNFGGPEQFQETLLKINRNAADFAAAIPAMKARLKAAERSNFERLLDYSWYFDPEMNADEFFALAELVDRKDESAINQTMVEHFRARLEAIESDLSAKHGKRTRILAEAFRSHRGQRYALSIPVFLTQADGISRELIGAEYFMPSKSKGFVERLLQEVAGDLFLEAALRTLRPTGAMRVPTSEMKDGSFNRHGVIHGSDVDYDNELNSLKAISVLNFMSRMNAAKQERLLSKAQ